MAELVIIASVIQIADIGLRLSIKLSSFGEIVSRADKTVLAVSKDVSLTSSVLKELGKIFENDKDESSVRVSENAITTADEVVHECLAVFKEMEALILKKVPSLSAPGNEKVSRAAVLLEKLRWPYLLPKIQLLQSNLDRVKATMLLMLNVIMYAKQASLRSENPAVLCEQRVLIEELHRSRQDYTRMFEKLRLGVDVNPSDKEQCVPSHPNGSMPGFQQMESNISATPNSFRTVSASRSSGPTEQQQHPLDPTKKEPATDFRQLQLKQFIGLLTNIHEEINNPKYILPSNSCTRMKDGIQVIVKEEAQLWADQYGADWLKLVGDHLAAFSARSDVFLTQSCSPRMATPGHCTWLAHASSGPIPQVTRPSHRISLHSQEAGRYWNGAAIIGKFKRKRHKPNPGSAMVEDTTTVEEEMTIQDMATVQPSFKDRRDSEKPKANVVDELVALWTLLPET